MMGKLHKLQDDFRRATEDKNDYQIICQDLNNKLQGLERQQKDFDEILDEKENFISQLQAEMDDHEGLMQDLHQKLKKSELKLRQLTQTKFKDMQRDLRNKERVIADLNKKL